MVSFNEENRPVTRNARRKGKRLRTFVISFIGIILLIGTYFIIEKINQPKITTSSAAKSVNANKENKVTAQKTEGQDKSNDEAILKSYAEKLSGLTINSQNQKISLGNWDVSKKDGTIFFKASNIPTEELVNIYSLYDNGNVNPLMDWANKVEAVSKELSGQMDMHWNIEVGDPCVSVHPSSLLSTDLTNFSGSCGYSIPVLSGSDQENLTLLIKNKVQAPGVNHSASGEYILADSSTRKLTESDLSGLDSAQLRLARNEIYARHGYIFKSADLQQYFSGKSWYKPNSNYKGSLTKTEKDNVDLIKSKEEK